MCLSSLDRLHARTEATVRKIWNGPTVTRNCLAECPKACILHSCACAAYLAYCWGERRLDIPVTGATEVHRGCDCIRSLLGCRRLQLILIANLTTLGVACIRTMLVSGSDNPHSREHRCWGRCWLCPHITLKVGEFGIVLCIRLGHSAIQPAMTSQPVESYAIRYSIAFCCTSVHIRTSTCGGTNISQWLVASAW
jgi:hypothetical protein